MKTTVKQALTKFYKKYNKFSRTTLQMLEQEIVAELERDEKKDQAGTPYHAKRELELALVRTLINRRKKMKKGKKKA